MPTMLYRPTVCFTLSIAIALIGTGASPGQDPDHFVIGFERFGRHQDLSLEHAGELLISELNCTSCHPSNKTLLKPKRGPRLAGAGNRLRRDWLQQFITHPDRTRHGTTMPDVMHGLDAGRRSEAAAAIAALLETQTEPFATPKAGGALPVLHEFWRRGDPDRGRELYHTIGCVACHEPDADYDAPASIPSPIDALIEQLEPEELEEMGLARAARRVASIPHGNLAEKYSSRSLTMMLMDPQSVRPDARMPSLRLQPVEAADLTAYLMRDQAAVSDLAPPVPSPPNALDDRIEAGRRFFAELRCGNCHDLNQPVAANFGKPLEQLDVASDSSCLQNPTPNMPRYRLDAAQVAAIRATLLAPTSNDAASPEQIVEHRMLQLNCYGCHERLRASDDVVLGGVGRFRKPFFETNGKIDLGDEGRLPPPLTGVGRKLLPKALESVLGEKSDHRRPFMTIRMPAYHREAVADLIAQLPLADQADATNEATVFGSPSGLAEAGRELVNTGCVECHVFRGESLPGAVGIDLHDIATRVHPKWFLEFVRNPGEIKARTRMPTFFPEGQSNRKDLLEGNVDRQIAAIWYYLKKSEPLPEKISDAMSKDFELSPADRPIVLRTFMQEAGTHAIAVGFPGAINIAFDAEQVRLASGWKGRFLDARGTWFERFAPPADPLGEQVIAFPPGPSLTLRDAKGDAGPTSQPAVASPSLRFGGYRVDASGIPTFLYQLGIWDIEDRLEAGDTKDGQAPRVLRTWKIRRSDRVPSGRGAADLVLRAHAGQQLTPQGQRTMSSNNGLAVSIRDGSSSLGEIVDDGTLRHWMIPLPNEPEQVIQVEYRW